MEKKLKLEQMIRRYSNYKGVYISKEQHIRELEGCVYQPVFGSVNPVTLTQGTKLGRLIKWALG